MLPQKVLEVLRNKYGADAVGKSPVYKLKMETPVGAPFVVFKSATYEAPTLPTQAILDAHSNYKGPEGTLRIRA